MPALVRGDRPCTRAPRALLTPGPGGAHLVASHTPWSAPSAKQPPPGVPRMRAVGIRMLDLTREPPCPSFWGTNYSALHYYNPPPPGRGQPSRLFLFSTWGNGSRTSAPPSAPWHGRAPLRQWAVGDLSEVPRGIWEVGSSQDWDRSSPKSQRQRGCGGRWSPFC